MNRELSSCFNLWIPLDADDDSIAEMMNEAYQLESAISRMTKGEISIDELWQIAESNPMIPLIDAYQDEVEENLTLCLNY